MGLLKKHKSLVDMLRSASVATDHSQESQASVQTDTPAHHSHRSFFRRRNSRVSITPQSSSSSLKSPIGTPTGSDDESGDSSTLGFDKKDKKLKDRSRSKSKPRRTDSHHSLRRFFKILHPKDHLDHPHTHGHPQKTKAELPLLPLSNASTVAQKYDIGRFIGSGASGLVNLITALGDSKKVFALKKFRSKLNNESEHDYITKVKNEFLVGEYLRHQNLIHTIELIKEEQMNHKAQSPEFYIIMEYCPHDFFNLVMSGLMRKDEIFCYLKQIINGTNYLHLSGIAHRDLKLDNCVVDQNGILKLIDFGSAFQFRKPVDYAGGTGGDDVMLDLGHKLVFARGIVGSDPYLAPEVFQPVSQMGYDPRLADMWSIAIIFCCMVLKRFPWKIPKDLDPSFRAYCESPIPDLSVEDLDQLTMKTKELSSLKKGPERLLHLLPSTSRELMRGMLTVDTRKRFLMKEVLETEFYKSIDHCHYFEEGEDDPPALVWDSQLHTIAVSQPASEINLPTEGSSTATHTELDVQNETPSESVKEPSSSSTSEPVSRINSTISGTQDAPQSPHPEVGTLIRGKSHRHHLVTEEELEKMQAEKAKHKHSREGTPA